MAPTIGVYDSGIGGLTTLAVLQALMPACKYLYLADNKRMPFGSKSRQEIVAAASFAVKTLERQADAIVFGCNTASVTACPDGVFKLMPDLVSRVPEQTLLLATPLTLAGLGARERGFMCPDTPELAVLTEIAMSLKYKMRTRPDATATTENYLASKLAPFKGRAGYVLLGCSHYVYAAKTVKRLTGAPCTDGNLSLATAVKCAVCPAAKTDIADQEHPVPVTSFLFTGGGEEAKYRWLLQWLHRIYVPDILANAGFISGF